jgi:hypothetical protein
MSVKAGLYRHAQTGLGPVLTDWSGHGLMLVRPSTGKAAGQRFIPVQPGLGLAADILARPDFLKMAGAEFVFRDRFRGARFVCDGTYLRPLTGRAIVAQRSGSLAAPAVRLTLSGTSGSFVLPERPIIPGGLLIPGQSQLRVEFVARHSTATGVASLNVRFGLTGTTADSRAVPALPMTSTTGFELRADFLVSIATATTANGTNTLAPGGSGTNVTADVAGLDVTQDMAFSFDVNGGTTTDVFDLLFYRVTLIQ